MKRILPRFFRCFLIAALAAAAAVPLAPTGTAIGSSCLPQELVPPQTKLRVLSSRAALPGQAVTLWGSGFTANAQVRLALQVYLAGVRAVVVAGEGAADGAPAISVDPDGTFRYRGTVPFHAATSGRMWWSAVETMEGGRAASSFDLTIPRRQIIVSPGVSPPGETVEVLGAGWGVKTRGGVSSRITITIQDRDGNTIPNAVFGPFPISSIGEFAGTITVPTDVRETRLTVIATDNNGPAAEGGTGGFSANLTASAVLRVPTGVVTVAPSTALAGQEITVSGTGFPARTELSGLEFSGYDVLPSPPPVTNESGGFTVTLTPPFSYESALPGGVAASVLASVRVADVVGLATFMFAGPVISLSTESAWPGDTLTITGRGFSAFANVNAINIGLGPTVPTPNPLTDGMGSFTANVTVPALNPGRYTITVRTDSGYTGTAPILVRPFGGACFVRPEVAFRSLTDRGLLTLAAVSVTGERFDAYVPGLPGDTLTGVPLGVGTLVLTLAEDARVSVGGWPAVDVPADTPTFFALGLDVSVEVIEHDP